METKFGTTDSDIIFAGNGDNFLAGNAGDDILEGGNHDDILDGGSGDDILEGGNHDDILDGGSGDDILEGGNHNDILAGGSGNDSLMGEVGRDSLTGGDGADSFIFTSLNSFDIITDFNSSQGDQIIFDSESTGVAEIEDLTVHLGIGYLNNSEFNRVTSLYVDGERVIEFDTVISLEVEDFEFI
ncbi:hypothetical protein I4641_20220 [Waterburya agarophytonicola K14]|uniref:Calcium-binding protein n=1 Tax=Waterburya agarophytonicola KI4 TaxID=2874699 RepID=A0A964FLC4_9CYAN|nr:hypothetical protein [Waterburya agarophytonicola]MCC0179293.1 hypothetical protein [Waterburya agarophytonicola KI4]